MMKFFFNLRKLNTHMFNLLKLKKNVTYMYINNGEGMVIYWEV